VLYTLYQRIGSGCPVVVDGLGETLTPVHDVVACDFVLRAPIVDFLGARCPEPDNEAQE